MGRGAVDAGHAGEVDDAGATGGDRVGRRGDVELSRRPRVAAKSFPVPAGMMPRGMPVPASSWMARWTVPSPPDDDGVGADEQRGPQQVSGLGGAAR